MNTAPTPINLPRTLVNQLLHHAQQANDNEVCGFISSKDGEPVRQYPITNIAKNQAVRFKMNPSEQIDTMRTMRERGEELYAIYHSHPTSPAQPSATDLHEAGYPDALYLIISLSVKGVLEMRGFYINGDHTKEVEREL